MKKVLLILVTVMLIATFTVGCESKNENTLSDTKSPNKIVIKFGSVSAPSHPVIKALNDIFKPRVKELSGGNIDVQIFDSGSLGEESQILEQTQLGTVQMSSISEVIATVYPKINILNLPYVFENNEQVDAIIDGDLGKKVLDSLSEQKLVGLGIFENGFRVTTNSKKSINKLEDMKGLKIRTPQADAQISIFNAFGANVTPLNFNELFSALQQGVVDGQENGYNTIVTQSFYEVQPHLAVTNHMWGSFVIVANHDWWNSLPDDYKKAIQTAFNETSSYERKVSREQAEKNKQVCIDNGVKITNPNLTEFVKAVQPVYDNFYKKYPQYESLVKEILAAKK